jgi:hypothetical protein
MKAKKMVNEEPGKKFSFFAERLTKYELLKLKGGDNNPPPPPPPPGGPNG